MRVVLVSSPGAERSPHWSHATAAAMATCFVEQHLDVVWFAVVREDQQLPPPPPGTELRGMPPLRRWPLGRVELDNSHLECERALARSLREMPAAAVVHVGAGARGSPNIAWLAERMGSEAFVVARASEIVCHRGDLIDATGKPCAEFLDADRCRRCCGTWWRRPHAFEFRNRSDLLAGSLLPCAAVFVETAPEIEQLLAFGVPRRNLIVCTQPAAIAARVRGRRGR